MLSTATVSPADMSATLNAMRYAYSGKKQRNQIIDTDNIGVWDITVEEDGEFL